MQPLPFDSRRKCDSALVLFRDGGWVLVYVAAHDRLVWLDLTHVTQPKVNREDARPIP